MLQGLLTATFKRTATGISDPVSFGNYGALDHHIAFSITPASNTFGAKLEASVDGITWDSLTSTSGAANLIVTGKLYSQVRANVTALEASSTLQIVYAGR